jgi:hypothetical protein
VDAGTACATFNDRAIRNVPAKHVSFSCAERHNLTIRTHGRRFIRLTNALSMKMEKHCHAPGAGTVSPPTQFRAHPYGAAHDEGYGSRHRNALVGNGRSRLVN